MNIYIDVQSPAVKQAGALASLYGLVGCPQVTFARRGGRVVESVRAPLTDAELVRRLERLGT